MQLYIQIPSDGNWGNSVANADFDNLTQDELKELGWYKYIIVGMTAYEPKYKQWYTNYYDGSVVTMKWHKELKTGDELREVEKNEWIQVRAKRDDLLSKSDYTQLADAPITEAERQEWVAYRQALRDVTLQADPFEIVYPTSPKGQNLNIEVYRAE